MFCDVVDLYVECWCDYWVFDEFFDDVVEVVVVCFMWIVWWFDDMMK